MSDILSEEAVADLRINLDGSPYIDLLVSHEALRFAEWDARREAYLARLVVEAAEEEKRAQESRPYISSRTHQVLDAAVAAYRTEFPS